MSPCRIILSSSHSSYLSPIVSNVPFARIRINSLIQYTPTLSWRCKLKHHTVVARLGNLLALETDHLNRSGSMRESPSERCVPRRTSIPAFSSRICTARILRTPPFKKSEAISPRSKPSHSPSTVHLLTDFECRYRGRASKS